MHVYFSKSSTPSIVYCIREWMTYMYMYELETCVTTSFCAASVARLGLDAVCQAGDVCRDDNAVCDAVSGMCVCSVGFIQRGTQCREYTLHPYQSQVVVRSTCIL